MVIIVITHWSHSVSHPCVFAEHDDDGRGRSPQPQFRRWFDFECDSCLSLYLMLFLMFLMNQSINETHSAHSNNARARNASHHPVHVVSWHPGHLLWSQHDAVTHWCWISVLHWLYELASLVRTSHGWALVHRVINGTHHRNGTQVIATRFRIITSHSLFRSLSTECQSINESKEWWNAHGWVSGIAMESGHHPSTHGCPGLILSAFTRD